MLSKKLYLLICVNFFLLQSCDTVDQNNGVNTSEDWLVPSNQIFDGGPGKDGIPALANPNFSNISDISYLQAEDLVIVLNINNEIKIYPHPILDWHEIINDKIGDSKFAVTYCPLTGSGIVWNRVLDGEETTFGVSGLLYNSNLIPYDRKTNSNWSQMKLQSINGTLISNSIETLPMIETTFQTAKEMFNNANVVTTNTGYSRNYSNYPYGDYRTNNSSLIFPVNIKNDLLSGKERVLGIITESESKAYSIMNFEKDGEIVLDTLGNQKFLIYGNSSKNLIVAFDITEQANNTAYTLINSNLPWIIKDNNDVIYNIFGNSSNNSIKLNQAKSFIAYWFAWAAFYPETKIFEKTNNNYN